MFFSRGWDLYSYPNLPNTVQVHLSRSLYISYRKQLAALQRQTLAKFRQKLATLRPSIEVDAQLKALVKETNAAFEAQAKALVPDGMQWTYSYEKAAVAENIEENAALHLQTLQARCSRPKSTNDNLPISHPFHVRWVWNDLRTLQIWTLFLVFASTPNIMPA